MFVVAMVNMMILLVTATIVVLVSKLVTHLGTLIPITEMSVLPGTMLEASFVIRVTRHHAVTASNGRLQLSL